MIVANPFFYSYHTICVLQVFFSLESECELQTVTQHLWYFIVRKLAALDKQQLDSQKTQVTKRMSAVFTEISKF